MPPYLDHDPLTDRNPRPRYAVESDDEDDLKGTDGYFDVFSFESALEIEKHLPLILASGSAGIFLSSLLASRAHSAPTGVYAISTEANRNSHFKRIGYVAQQKGKYTILISESGPPQIVLPLPRMYPYAQWVIDKFQPSRVSILDTYSLSTYASPIPQKSAHAAPVRYLLTSSNKTTEITEKLTQIFDTQIEPFSPPNLVHSTAAAFMNASAFPSRMFNADKLPAPVLMLLLPSPQVGLLPSKRPRNFEEADEGMDHFDPGYSEDELLWSDELLQRVVKALFTPLDGPGDADMDREVEDLLRASRSVIKEVGKSRGGRQRLGEVGENGMYM